MTDPTPYETLDQIRKKMESVANDFAAGKINRAQFNAIYGHYNEQRALIERLYQRNPERDVWRQAAQSGHTGFLKSYYESKAEFYIVFRHHDKRPLTLGGQQPSDTSPIGRMIGTVWRMEEMPAHGLARKALNDGRWLVLALGEHSLTVVIFSRQPTAAQYELVRDLHNDFERANRIILTRNLSFDRLVFPQRSLLI